MPSSFISSGLTAIVALLVAIPVQAKDIRFRLAMAATVDGVELKEGHYTLKLESEGNPQLQARIFHNGKLMAEALVQVRPRAEETPNTVLQDGDGALRELRFKKQVVVFAASS